MPTKQNPTAAPAASRQNPVHRIDALFARFEEFDYESRTHTHRAAYLALIREVAALMGELNPPTTVTLCIPKGCVEIALGHAKKAGLTLGQYYSFILTGDWDDATDSEGVDGLLHDTREEYEDQDDGQTAAPEKPWERPIPIEGGSHTLLELGEDTVTALDAYARDHGMSRDDVMNMVLRDDLTRRGLLPSPMAAPFAIVR